MEELYNEYFGANTAPINFNRLEYIARDLIKSIITTDEPEETGEMDEYIRAILEQIYYLDQNKELLDNIYNAGSGYSIGKFKKDTKSVNISTKDTIKRISPNTYTILLNLGMLYSGVC